jgi:acyl-[acyl-carrier-protein]-phospholipid O-acyltransferase/long-chain-fatty-acid--[acyl-carrier-protein] ligase
LQLSDKTERSLDPVALRGFWGVILAQFFGVFNDNALKWFLQALSIRTVTETSRRDFLVALAGALFLGPYLFFSTHAGCVADRFSKRHVLLVSKCTEVGIMALGIAVFELRREDFLPWLLALLFLLGCQSTYYAPAKYGILPQLLPVSLLSWGNGLLEFTGFLAIIAGTIAGAHFVGWFDGAYHFALLVFTAVAVFGVAASLWVPRVPAIAPQRRLQLNPCPLLARHGRLLLRHRGLLFSILGVVFSSTSPSTPRSTWRRARLGSATPWRSSPSAWHSAASLPRDSQEGRSSLASSWSEPPVSASPPSSSS